MSWLIRNNPIRTSFSKPRSRDSPPKDADPSACYDSFCKHWQQTHEIIVHSLPPKGIPSQDDVLGVVNHVEQVVTLLMLELRDSTSHNHHYRQQSNATATHSPCLEYLLSENLLVKLYDWSVHTGRFNNAVRLQQIKLYELLVSHSCILLAHEPVARPLLRLLEDCTSDIMPPEVEQKLVVLLNQLCVALMQNMALLDLFFQPNATGKNKFIIFNLLIHRIHKESVCQQARDAMLLCMSLSKKNDEVGSYIAEHSDICSVLAYSLSAFYSDLPRNLDIETDDWHQLTPDDVNDLPALTQFMNLLEFCNAIAQVAHPIVQKQLLEFLYQGFLVPVMGPALLQESVGLTVEQLDAQQHWTTLEELVTSTAYFDLFLRSVTEPGLLRSLVRFLLEDNYDDTRILDSLIKRISSRSRLCIVTLALFETLVNLNCEDVMLELCLGALMPCSHVMLSQRSRLRDVDPFGRAAEKFLSLTPRCCSASSSSPSSSSSSSSSSDSGQTNSLPGTCTYEKSASDPMRSLPATIDYGTRLRDSLYGNYHAYLCDARQKIKTCRIACANWSCRYDGNPPRGNSNASSANTLIDESDPRRAESVVPARTSPSGNVAPNVVATAASSTRVDNDREDAAGATIDAILLNIQSFVDGKDPNGNEHECVGDESAVTIVAPPLSAEEQAKLDADIAELLNEDIGVIVVSERCADGGVTCYHGKKEPDLCCACADESATAMNSLMSLGESSGYESFAFKGSPESTPENEMNEDRISEHDEEHEEEEKEETDNNTERKEEEVIGDEPNGIAADSTSVSTTKETLLSSNRLGTSTSCRAQQQDVFNGQPNVGTFLDVVLRKLECMTSNNLYVNLHLTGLISRLAIYPQPLLQSFLLNHSLVFQPSIRSLFQVLASLKHKIDQFLSRHNNVELLVEQARSFLISREGRLVNARKNAIEAAAQSSSVTRQRHSLAGEIGEARRRSLTSSFTQIFKRTTGVGFGPSSLTSSVSQPSSISEDQLQVVGSGGYRYRKTSWESPNEISPVQNVILCAVVLDEWLKELAAITQEHAIMSVTDDIGFKF